jgi:hypothetical protein
MDSSVAGRSFLLFVAVFVLYITTAFAADIRAEIASVDFQDVSGTTDPDGPTAEEMLKLVLQRVHRVDDEMHERVERCLAGDYQNDPALFMTCVQFIPISHEQRDFHVRLKSFRKLGCVPRGSNKQFECRFETSFDSSSSMFTGDLGRMFSTPGVQKALLIHNADDSWTMTY